MNKVLLVTGGATGIGAATVRLAAATGYDVAIHCHPSRRAEADGLLESLAGGATRAIVVEADVREEDAIQSLFRHVAEKLGPLDALVNCAGIDMPPTPIDALQAGQVRSLLEVNVVAVMLCCREAVRRMSTRHGGNGGVIVNISSMAATIGGRPGFAPYAASKAAIDAFTIGLAREVAGAGIRAIAVRPGVVRTPMTEGHLAQANFRAAVAASIPLGRVAEPIEIARPILFALSGEASFMSGCTLDVSGGGFRLAGPAE